MIMTISISSLLAKCAAVGAAAVQMACSSVPPASNTLATAPVRVPDKAAQQGIASIYTDHRTASGERFSSGAMTAAHKSLPLGSSVRVTHLGTSKSVIVRINDRGPYVKGRVIDLTPAAAAKIGLSTGQGLAKVKIEPVEPESGNGG